MGSIMDKLSYLKQTKALIRKAIEGKGVAISDTDAFSTYPNKISSIKGDPFLVEDIFNHNKTEWLNTIFCNCVTNATKTSPNSYSLVGVYNGSSYIGEMTTRNSVRCIHSGPENTFTMLPIRLSRGDYRYLYIDLETVARDTGYTMLRIGICENYMRLQKGATASPNIVLAEPTWYVQNSHKTANKKEFTRNIIQLNIEDYENFILGWHGCDQHVYIYSMWLSNEEVPHYDFSQDYV